MVTWVNMSPRQIARFLWLMRSQWTTPSRLKEIQHAKLRLLIAHAYRNVPYYRRLMNHAGMQPEDIDDLKALSKLPVTRKPSATVRSFARQGLLGSCAPLPREP